MDWCILRVPTWSDNWGWDRDQGFLPETCSEIRLIKRYRDQGFLPVLLRKNATKTMFQISL